MHKLHHQYVCMHLLIASGTLSQSANFIKAAAPQMRLQLPAQQPPCTLAELLLMPRIIINTQRVVAEAPMVTVLKQLTRPFLNTSCPKCIWLSNQNEIPQQVPEWSAHNSSRHTEPSSITVLVPCHPACHT